MEESDMEMEEEEVRRRHQQNLQQVREEALNKARQVIRQQKSLRREEELRPESLRRTSTQVVKRPTSQCQRWGKEKVAEPVSHSENQREERKLFFDRTRPTDRSPESQSESREEDPEKRARTGRKERQCRESTKRKLESLERQRQRIQAQLESCVDRKTLVFGKGRNEDPEEFLERLSDCPRGTRASDIDWNVLPYIFQGEAGCWFRAKREKIQTWTEFCREFRHRYVTKYNREDLMEDLRWRTQHKAYRNILPEYRKASGDKLIDSLEDLEKYGRRWEKHRDLDSQYAPPLPVEKMHVPGAAYTGGVTKPKVAAVETVEKEKESEETPKKGKKSKAKKATTSASVSESEKVAALIIVVRTRRRYFTLVPRLSFDNYSSGKLEVGGPEIMKPVPPEQKRTGVKETRGVTFAQPLVKLDETERKDKEEARQFAELKKVEEKTTRLLSENEEGISTRESADEGEVVAGANTENRKFLSVSLEGHVYQALLDPGATLSLIDPKIAKRFRVILDIGGKEQGISFKAAPSLEQPMILGMDFCKKFDCDVRLRRGLWRTEESEWRPFADTNNKEEAIVYVECAGLSAIMEEEHAEIRCLGFLLDKEGLRPDPERVEPVKNFPAPKNVKQLMRFLGMLGWYSLFIERESKLKGPLVRLLRKNQKWE
ncbi:hypothetical protein TSAR_000767 [Trichomalopsis sarcophagae]|uniref:Uncharacterized protein n=1 Tax=Trichomalopsis sarcophagae TaxID=543379 RepID=A0A232EJC1_9HYME|nr:hypothetical protein TSAR_000767 [Trichomalopsis sarcophagae]